MRGGTTSAEIAADDVGCACAKTLTASMDDDVRERGSAVALATIGIVTLAFALCEAIGDAWCVATAVIAIPTATKTPAPIANGNIDRRGRGSSRFETGCAV